MPHASGRFEVLGPPYCCAELESYCLILMRTNQATMLGCGQACLREQACRREQGAQVSLTVLVNCSQTPTPCPFQSSISLPEFQSLFSAGLSWCL